MPAGSGRAGDVSVRLRVNEIFYSLQGEGRNVGLPTVFVRLTGCPLRCGYCDTEYAFHTGQWMELPAILDQVAGFRPRHVTVTGGEPLAQRPCTELLRSLCDNSYAVSLETSGAVDIRPVDARVSIVMDIKTPGSGEEGKNIYGNVDHLRAKDEIKFVICDRGDYEWSRTKLTDLRLPEVCEILFAPAYGRMNPTELADWILADHLPVRLQIQMHKLLWGEAPGH